MVKLTGREKIRIGMLVSRWCESVYTDQGKEGFALIIEGDEGRKHTTVLEEIIADLVREAKEMAQYEMMEKCLAIVQKHRIPMWLSRKVGNEIRALIEANKP